MYDADAQRTVGGALKRRPAMHALSGKPGMPADGLARHAPASGRRDVPPPSGARVESVPALSVDHGEGPPSGETRLDAARVSTGRWYVAADYRRRVPSLLAVLALHVLIFALFLSYRRTESPLTPAAAIQAQLITAPRVVEAPPPLKPVTLKQPPMQIVVPAPIVAIADPAALPATAPPSAAVPAAVNAPPAPAPVSPPRFDAAYLRNPAPVYPLQARRLRERGTVLLRVEVSAAGGALQVMVEQGSGWPLLDDAALAAVRHWRFEPARRGSEPVAAWVLVPIEFDLRRR